jgi:thiamine-monophosphate kinase
VGDVVHVTGRLGGPGAALEALLGGRLPEVTARARFIAPTARIGAGQWLAAHGATALIDISDGLLADAGHLANASEISVSIDIDAVPCLDGYDVSDALTSGEEYELLVCVASDAVLDTRAFERTFGIPLTRIGAVVARQGNSVLTTADAAAKTGHDHLAR